MGGNNKSLSPSTSTNADSTKGTGFSPYIKPTHENGASAPEASSAASSLAHPETCLSNFAGPEIDTDWGTRDLANTSPFYDGLSYHQGSVWPLFTGWGALAEYRANQPLSGEQLLMQNVDLTWAQDPGAVTELLSGDFFVPFGRSTSHQLWSSAMVITPTLRGLFGINLDAATNTITVNPHLPANWDHAEVDNIRFGSSELNNKFTLFFERANGSMQVSVLAECELIRDLKSDIPFDTSKTNCPKVILRSDMPGAKLMKAKGEQGQDLFIPLPDIEVALGTLSLPNPGSRTVQPKLISQQYGPHKLKLTFEGQPDSRTVITLIRNQKANIKSADLTGPSASLEELEVKKGFTFPRDFLRFEDHDAVTHNPKELTDPIRLEIHFPKGQGYQTLEFTLTW
jgi:hypothetical protein